MLVIGLTGPSGAGKGAVSALFAEYGIPVIDADRVYHKLLIPPSPCLDALCMEFGATILSNDGTLNRKKLGEIVFGNSNALQKLNEISHRFVMEEIRNQLKKLRNKDLLAAVIDAPQLFEAGADRECNIVVSVLADKRLRLERIIERDDIDAESAMRRMDAQRSDEFFRTHSNYIIENNGSIDHLRPQVKRILAEMGVVAP